MPSKTNSLNPNQPNSNSTPPQSSLAKFKKLDYGSLSQDGQSEGFIFHILSDFVSNDSREKLSNLAKELSRIYPCEIHIHIANDEIFKGLPKLNNNYLAYFRLFIPNFMPKNTKLCLYLDTDMLVLKDLRGLFALDLEDKVAGIILDQLQFCFANQPEYYYADKFSFHNFYFNSGFLLINLGQWQKLEIYKNTISFLRSYNVISHDQDALNVAIRKENALVLPLEFNIFTLFFPQQDKTYNLLNGFQIDYTQDEMKFALTNPVIIHFACSPLKPWKLEQFDYVLSDGTNIALLWWEIAFQTPFIDEMKNVFYEQYQAMSAVYNEYKDEYYANNIFKGYIASLIWQCSKSVWGYIKMPFVIYKAFSEFVTTKSEFYTNISLKDLDKALIDKLYFVARKAWKRELLLVRIAKFAILPFRIKIVIKRAILGAKKRESVYHQLYTKI